MEAARSYRNVGKHLPDYAVSHLRKQQSSEDESVDMHLLDNCCSRRELDGFVFEIGTAVLLSTRHDPPTPRFHLALRGVSCPRLQSQECWGMGNSHTALKSVRIGVAHLHGCCPQRGMCTSAFRLVQPNRSIHGARLMKHGTNIPLLLNTRLFIFSLYLIFGLTINFWLHAAVISICYWLIDSHNWQHATVSFCAFNRSRVRLLAPGYSDWRIFFLSLSQLPNATAGENICKEFYLLAYKTVLLLWLPKVHNRLS